MNDDPDVSDGLNINLNPSILRRESSGKIEYPSGNWLTYKRNGRSAGYVFVYHAGGRDVVLNNLVDDKYRLLPTNSNFRVVLREDGRPKEFPEVHMCVPELEKEASILASLHECGHTRVHDRLLQVYDEACENGQVDASGWRALHKHLGGATPAPSRTSSVSGRAEAVRKMIEVVEFFSERMGDNGYDKLQERSAWGFALTTAREFGIPSGVSRREMLEYARDRLGTYGESFLYSR